MRIDYELATKAIGNAMRGIGNGIESIESLVGGSGNYRQPALAFAGGLGPELYRPRAGNAPALDAYLRDCNSTTKPVTNVPRAKYFLEQLFG